MRVKLRKQAVFVFVFGCTCLCVNLLLPVFHQTSDQNTHLHSRSSFTAISEQNLGNNTDIYRQRFHPSLRPDEIRTMIDFNIERVFSFDSKTLRSSSSQSIPKIIHFMWKNEYIPTVFVENVISFYKLNPEWSFYFWTDKTSERFIRDHYPKVYDFLNDYNLNVSKSDAIRYAIINHFGGAYFDLDTRCLKPLDRFIGNAECILAPEPRAHAVVVMHTHSILGNCMMFCKPKHDFFRHVLSELQLSNRASHFMLAAGPIFFGNALNSYINMYQRGVLFSTDTIHIMPSEIFLDYVKRDVLEMLSKYCDRNYFVEKDDLPLFDNIELMRSVCRDFIKRGGVNRKLSNLAYTVHLYFGTYNSGDKLDELKINHIENLIPKVKYYPFDN